MSKRAELMVRIDADSPGLEQALYHAVMALTLIREGTGDPVERARVGLRLVDQTLENKGRDL